MTPVIVSTTDSTSARRGGISGLGGSTNDAGGLTGPAVTGLGGRGLTADCGGFTGFTTGGRMTGGLIEGGVVTGGLITGGFVTGGLTIGGFVTGGLMTGGFVTGGLMPGLMLGGFAALWAMPAPLTMLLPIERPWPCLVLNPFI